MLKTEGATALCLLLWTNVAFSLDLSCEPGWQSRGNSASCYNFVKSTATRASSQDARTYCQRHGAELVVVNDGAEVDYIARVAGENSLGDETWWIGIQYNETAGDYRWISGESIDTEITPWEGGSAPPPNSTLCGELHLTGLIDVKDCGTTQRFICEKALGAKIECNSDWTQYGSSCFIKLDAGEQTWQEADRLCGDKDAIIAIPNDHIEDRFLHDMALKENGNIWLGIRENQTNAGQWLWSDGSNEADAHKNWDEGQPVSQNGGMAGYLSMETGKWATQPESDKLVSICEKTTGSFCQFNMRPNGNKCYDFNLDMSVSYDWVEDKAACSIYGMKLVTIESAEEDEWINSQLYDTGLFSNSDSNVDGMWIGYSGATKSPPGLGATNLLLHLLRTF